MDNTRPTYHELSAELSAAQFQLDMMARLLERIDGTLQAAGSFCPTPIQRDIRQRRAEIEHMRQWSMVIGARE